MLKWSSASSSDASRALRFLRVAAPRLRVVICDGVSTESSSIASTDVARSDLMRLPACDSLSAATVSVCDKMEWLRLRSRTEPPARDDAMLPGLFRFGGALRRDRPDRVSCSTGSSAFGSEEGTASGTGSSTAGSLSLPLPLARDLRCDFGFDGLCLGVVNGTKSSMGSGTGRGLAAGVPERLIDFFHRLLADVGVPVALYGDRGLSGVENDCLA